MKAINNVIIISIVAVLVAGKINAQDAASHRMLILPTANPLPDRVTLGAHTIPYPPTIIPQLTIPFGSRVGTIIYFGGGGYEGSGWAIGSVALKYTPIIPDSSHFGVAVIGQTIGAVVGGYGWFGGGISPSIQVIGSSPIKRFQVLGGMIMYYDMKNWNASPLLGIDFSATRSFHITTEILMYKPGPYSRIQYFILPGIRINSKSVTVDIGTGISLQQSKRYDYYKDEWHDELEIFWIPPIIAFAIKF